jgi:hypothetical protein
MDAWEMVLVIVVGVLVVLFVGGLLGNARVRRARSRSLADKIAAADRALADARAEDRGWDPALLEAAARTAFEALRPGIAADSLRLVQVVDRPGTDEDRALMRVTHAAGADEIELQRSGDRWSAS